MNIFPIKLIKPMIGKNNLTCHLEEDLYNTLEQVAAKKFVGMNTLIDVIVQRFNPSFDDILFFMKGEYPITFLERFKKFFQPKQLKRFATFQLDTLSTQRINGLKNYYNLSRSVILKHIIIKYMKDNKYV